jgi:mycofactocin glycosyltransferase
MIPLIYRLRTEVKVEERSGYTLIVSSMPLTVVRVRRRGAQILALSNGSRNISQIAAETGAPETTVLALSEYFNRKGVLETLEAEKADHFPSVTVIIPVRDRENEIGDCLVSVFAQNYPPDLIEVIVVDDGSKDRSARIASTFPGTVISLEESHGQSYCRNLAARQATGEIIAFLDSDCVAGAEWLRELVTFFQWDRIGAVGGRVDGFYHKTALDRYEMAFSSLNMGKYYARGTQDHSNLYVPTCNLLVRKDVYRAVGGIRDDMLVGEDVDLCWRVREAGSDLLYAPVGSVAHKHRNGLIRMLRRRFDYGTSEATLYRHHPDKRKTFGIHLWPALSFLVVCIAVVLLSPLPLLLPLVCMLAESIGKARKIGRFGVAVPFGLVLFSVVRGYLSSSYFLSYHIVRYYLLVLLLVGFFLPSIWLAAVFLVATASVVDYSVKRPRIDFSRFLIYYVLEHAFYQTGVFLGCLRERAFGSYVPRFKKEGTGAV